MKKENTVELLELEAEDFSIGDYITSKSGQCNYLIVGAGTTTIHCHDYLDVIYAQDGKRKKLLISEIRGKRLVFRPKFISFHDAP